MSNKCYMKHHLVGMIMFKCTSSPNVFLFPHLSFQDENDVYILTKVSDILHSVFSSYKEKVLPWFEQLLQLIVQLIVSTFMVCAHVLIDSMTCRQCSVFVQQ